MLRDSGSGLAPRFNAPLLPSEASDLPASAISQLAEADAFLELILYREREMILFLSFYLYGAALAGGSESSFSLPIRQPAERATQSLILFITLYKDRPLLALTFLLLGQLTFPSDLVH